MNRTEEIVRLLESLSDRTVREGMKRFGIPTEYALGIPLPKLRRIAKTYGKEHEPALQLWQCKYHEAKILASMMADPLLFAAESMDRWSSEFYSWDICDQCCYNLFRYTALAFDKTYEYAAREPEFVRRTAFALMAGLAIGDKKAPDERFVPFFDLILRYSDDSRNFVRKAVNWALRQTGKRNLRLHALAVEVSRELASSPDKTASRTGREALRELTSPKIIARIKP